MEVGGRTEVRGRSEEKLTSVGPDPSDDDVRLSSRKLPSLVLPLRFPSVGRVPQSFFSNLFSQTLFREKFPPEVISRSRNDFSETNYTKTKYCRVFNCTEP